VAQPGCDRPWATHLAHIWPGYRGDIRRAAVPPNTAVQPERLSIATCRSTAPALYSTTRIITVGKAISPKHRATPAQVTSKWSRERSANGQYPLFEPSQKNTILAHTRATTPAHSIQQPTNINGYAHALLIVHARSSSKPRMLAFATQQDCWRTSTRLHYAVASITHSAPSCCPTARKG
jgi:hypothetical protein